MVNCDGRCTCELRQVSAVTTNTLSTLHEMCAVMADTCWLRVMLVTNDHVSLRVLNEALTISFLSYFGHEEHSVLSFSPFSCFAARKGKGNGETGKEEGYQESQAPAS